MNFTEGLGVPEGPVLMPDGGFMVVEMAPDRGCVTKVNPDGSIGLVVAKTGRPNGLAMDADGHLWVAESEEPSLIKLSQDGEIEVFMTECDDEPFLFPNDLAFGPDGLLYMTDSGILIEDFAPNGEVRDDWATVPIDGRVYQIDVHQRTIQKVDSGIRFTNGIAFGPDDRLYVNETVTGMIFRYTIDNGVVGPREDFGNVLVPTDDTAIRGPDGMKFSEDGDLYVTVVGQGDVTVLGPDGDAKLRLPTNGNFPTNLAWGPPGSKRIYVTEDQHGTLEVIDVDVDGAPLYYGA